MDIIATIGPSLESTEQIMRAAEAGACIFRIPLGYERDHLQHIENILDAQVFIEKKLHILLDFPSSRPRISGSHKWQMSPGREYILCSNSKAEILNEEIPVTYFHHIYDNACIGDELFFLDGQLKVAISKKEKKEIHISCILGEGTLKQGNSVSLKSDKASYHLIRESDISLIASIVNKNIHIEWVALSFSESAQQLNKAREELASLFKSKPKIVAKIETREAVYRIRNISSAADGMMVARGDLASQIGPLLLAEAQEEIVKLCNEKGLYSIIATELLEHFAETGHFSRPEVNGLSLSVSQLPSALQLGKETVWSNHPIETIRELHKFIEYELFRLALSKIRLPKRQTIRNETSPLIIAIEGPNGSGKSTLVKSLCEYYEIPYHFGVPDALLEKNIKEEMIKNAHWFSSALFFLSGAIEQIRNSQNISKKIIVLDRSFWSTLAVHASNSAHKLRTCIDVAYALDGIDIEPDITIILRASYETCRMRIHNKSDEEKALDELVNYKSFYQREDQFYNWLGYQRDNIINIKTDTLSPKKLIDNVINIIEEFRP